MARNKPEEVVVEASPPIRVKVSQHDGLVEIFDGEGFSRYQVKDGIIEVSEKHAAGMLVGGHGAPESPVEIATAEAPLKENNDGVAA